MMKKIFDKKYRASFLRKPAYGLLLVCVFMGLVVLANQALAQSRIRDLTSVQGVRSNPLFGYGIVIGLDGTGDQTTQAPFTGQSIAALLAQSGINLPAGNVQLKNVAAVMVTANLPAFAQPGQLMDITVSSIGNAKSLRGGMLMMTPLKGADGQVYALAQGQLIVGGAGASAGGSKTVINHLSAGRIPNGATVERVVPTPFLHGETLQLELNGTDFSNATRVAQAINTAFGDNTAQALDGRIVQMKAPQNPNDRVAFLSKVQELTIDKAVGTAKIIVNARTGSVVMNQAVRLENCAVSHGNLTVKITSTPVVSQPGALSAGQTVVAQENDIQISQSGGELIQLKSAAQLSDVVKALNTLGATPQDLVSILQAMQSAGSLKADIEVI
jgi:flagellar P-ring protein precursor FlgI